MSPLEGVASNEVRARGRLSPPQYKKGAKQMPNELVKQISYILYKADEEDVKVNALLKDESIWLTQNSMAELFDVNVPAVSKHLKNIYECGELDEASTISILETVQKEGTRSVKRNVTFYNLDAIISVGYRVNSAKATKFRIWATNVLKEYIKKGFVLDDERLKQGKNVFGKDYFRELLERVRSIRASERRIWQQITDIFAQVLTNFLNSESTIFLKEMEEFQEIKLMKKPLVNMKFLIRLRK